MKRKSTDRKYGKEFFLFLAIMMLTFGVVLRGQNFSQLKSTLIRMKPVYVGAALFLSVLDIHLPGSFFPGSRRLHREDSPCSFII